MVQKLFAAPFKITPELAMPWIHDVSTAADDPPPFIALREVRLACTNGVAYSGPQGEEQRLTYPDLLPLLLTQSLPVIFHAALAVCTALRWVIAAAEVNPAQGRIEATAITRWMRFKDDVVIRMRLHPGGSHLDMRSASRVGSSDFGANAKRIRMFLHELNIQLKISA